jgi:hypothetical protein
MAHFNLGDPVRQRPRPTPSPDVHRSMRYELLLTLSINEPRPERSEALRHRKERVRKFGGEGLELGSSLRRRRYFFLSADEPMTIGLDHASTWLTVDQV